MEGRKIDVGPVLAKQGWNRPLLPTELFPIAEDWVHRLGRVNQSYTGVCIRSLLRKGVWRPVRNQQIQFRRVFGGLPLPDQGIQICRPASERLTYQPMSIYSYSQPPHAFFAIC